MPKIQPQTDTDLLLIQALQAGDAEVLQELIDRHDRLVRGAIYAVLGHCDQMDDVAQKVWLTVWRKIDTLDDVQRWKSWLYRLARNAALDAGRKRQRRKGLWEKIKAITTADQPTQLNSEEAYSHTVGGQPNPAWGTDPQHQLMQKEKYDQVLKAIEAIPALYREPFVLRHLEGASYQEIADMLDMPIDTVGTRLVRARKMLKDQLEGTMS